MSDMHDYSIVGHQRSVIGRYLGIVAFVLPGIITAIINHFVEFLPAGWTGLAGFTISSSLLYLALHWLFNNLIWKIKCLESVLGFPDLGGTWHCEAQTLDFENKVLYEWSAEVVITQTWEKICIALKAKESRSVSQTATLRKKEGVGYLLAYSYHNEPNGKNHELQQHFGFCEFVFNPELTEAEGRYFNSRGRNTFGRMKLTRVVPTNQG